MTYQINHIAVGLLRKGDNLVLVQQHLENRPPVWVLPGGLVEPGELFHEALIREVAEESGATVEAIGRLAYCMQIDHPEQGLQTIAYCFEIEAWSGELCSADPDDEILQVALVPLTAAPALLREIHWTAMREPLLTYLSGTCPPGTLWLYREEEGVQALHRCIPGAMAA